MIYPDRSFPTTQMRRVRQVKWCRDMVSETSLSVKDLILPLFIREPESSDSFSSMPGIKRYTLEELPFVCEEACALGIPAVALFPYTPEERKNPDATESLSESNLINRALLLLKKKFGDALGRIADVALDPYTDHGHDGIVKKGRIDNEASLEILSKQAVIQAQCGADIIAPSDMMDGRVGAIRKALDKAGFSQTMILSYSAKYASSFYGPFRDAIGSGKVALSQHEELKHKLTYQMDPRNGDEALHETAIDIQEGADMIMVKPGLPYLDILYRIKEAFRVPTFVYQVSGEYSMLRIVADQGFLDYERTLLETLFSLKRAGADGILTYAALDAARILSRR